MPRLFAAPTVASMKIWKPGPARSIAKRTLDTVVATVAMLVLCPVLIAIAMAIKVTSRGPVLFIQLRYGLNNQLFTIYKFRTMYVDVEDRTGIAHTHFDDRRVTSIGKVLRRLSLDELPQLINVIRGDMSLVGPRPHVPGMIAGGCLYEVLVPNYFERHRIRPGLTGLAQAHGFRGCAVNPDLAKARIAHDLSYIENWSLALDFRIIVETIRIEILKAGNGI